MHFITVHNKSNHPQEFQVHGYNDNKNITVAARAKHVLPAADGTSGAIIALHDGVECEQAEITKDGYGGNDFLDISNEMGAGGNLTVQQTGTPVVIKGNPLFMQQCNAAWRKANEATKKAIKDQVFLDHNGHVQRIGPPKNYPALMKFVRSFDEGKSYIGPGAWNGQTGDRGDNEQSSGGQGDKDVLVTYSDDDANPDVPHHLEHRASHISNKMVEQKVVPAKTTQAAHKASEPQGAGIILHNEGNEQEFFFYDNHWNALGTAGVNYDKPLKSVKMGAKSTVHVSLPMSFKGRVQRGTQLPATWVEFQIHAANDGAAHGDVSLEQGCDGAATIASTDGSKVSNGFHEDILKDAPDAAVKHKPNGEKALASTMGNWMGKGNMSAVKWETEKLGHGKVYITGGTGVPDVASHNNCLAVTFY